MVLIVKSVLLQQAAICGVLFSENKDLVSVLLKFYSLLVTQTCLENPVIALMTLIKQKS